MQGNPRPTQVALIMVLLLMVGGFLPIKGQVKAAPAQPGLPAAVTGSICLSRPEIPDAEMHWLYVPLSASELRTEVNYGYLAAQLISNGYVDAKSCPAGGLGLYGYANACGLAAAKPAVVRIQNMFDEAILNGFKEAGVPPVMLKQLIRYESQFWPGQFGFHYGLGHMTYLGAHAALNWSPILYQEACNIAYGGNCQQQPVDDLMIGAFLGLMAATCPTCELGIDEAKANRSIFYLSHALLAICRQTAQVVVNATAKSPEVVVDYPMIWKLTLFNYNVGPTCLYNAIGKAYEYEDKKVDWKLFTKYVEDEDCQRGLDYANQIIEPFYNFPPPQ